MRVPCRPSACRGAWLIQTIGRLMAGPLSIFSLPFFFFSERTFASGFPPPRRLRILPRLVHQRNARFGPTRDHCPTRFEFGGRPHPLCARVLCACNLIVASEIVACLGPFMSPSLYYPSSRRSFFFLFVYLIFSIIGSRAVVVPSPVPRSFLSVLSHSTRIMK